jgi:hypothetical protein
MYVPGAAQLATITNGTSAAPWNEWQGDSSAAAYASVSPGTVLPTYTPGGAMTGSGSTAEPNVSINPGANSGTDGSSPYPSGTVGTPGPLDGYCGSGNQVTESAGSPVRQPAGTTLPIAPAYFPHVVSNGDGTLTGYFDYRPKDADESIMVGRSADGGRSWTYEGQALEQNPGFCPSDDTNDDGQGHPNVITVGGVARLYTLQRAAGDNPGVGLLVHAVNPAATNPLATVPATEKVGIDPDAFATGPVSVPTSGASGVTIAVSIPGASGVEQLLAGKFVDLTQTPTPTAASVITCATVGATTLGGCTTAAVGGLAVATGDLVEQVIGTVATAATIPPGPNKSTGDGGLAALSVSFVSQTLATLYNADAPNRAYVDGVGVYCNQANANPTTKIEDCTTGPGGSAVAAAVGDPVTSDPIVPATATQTTGLIAPDGIVGVTPTYPGAPAGTTTVLYTEKVLNYFVAGTTTNSANATFGASIAFTPGASTAQDLPATVSAANPVTVSIGDATKTSIIAVTCTGLTVAATDTLTGCSVPSADTGDVYSKTSLIGAPGAAVVPAATLALTGEGSTSTAKLFKNSEDLTVLRAAYTSDGISFSAAGLANAGVISGASNGASSYSDISNPSATSSPANLNAYATPGTADATELRYVGSAGSIITNPDGSIGLFLSGAWAADGDSDAFNQIFYTTSTDGQTWSVPTTVLSTDYTFSASQAQDASLAAGSDQPLGISAYYSGRVYGPSVVQNADGSLTMVFAGYRLPKTFAATGTSLGTNTASPYVVGNGDPAAYRNILTLTLSSSTTPGVTSTTALTQTPGSPVAGQPVTYTATVAVPAPGHGTATGTVSFTDAAGSLCSAVAVSDSTPDTATCTTSYPSSQSDTVTASYSGDSNYAPSSGTDTVTIGAGPPATLVISPSTATIAGGHSQSYTANATDSGGDALGDVTAATTFAISPDGECTAANCTAAIPGPHTVTATDGAASTTASLTVTPGPQIGSVSNVIAVGDDLSQYALDFLADGDTSGDPGANTAFGQNRLDSIDATADADGRTAYQQGSTTAAPALLSPSVVLSPGTSPVQRPSNSTAAIDALLAGGNTNAAVDIARSTRLPTTAEQSTAGAAGFGGIHAYQYATLALTIAVDSVATNAPSGLSVAELLGIYQGTYLTWGQLPGYTGPAPGDPINALLPAPGTDTRILFDADLSAANAGHPVIYGGNVTVVAENDYTALTGPDTIVPFSAAQLTLIAEGYFATSAQAAALDGIAPDGTPSYQARHPLYLLVRDSDVAATGSWRESSHNWATALITAPQSFLRSTSGQAVLIAAGLTPSYVDLGDPHNP